MWDMEVDIAVIGAGIGGLANAIASVDAGGEVLVADSSRSPCQRHAVRLAPWVTSDCGAASRSWLRRDTWTSRPTSTSPQSVERLPDSASILATERSLAQRPQSVDR